MSVLYITQNGITDHIGRSQVAPYVFGLAKQGFKIHVLSAEKSGKNSLISQYQKLFDEAGVRWTRVKYINNPPILGQAWTQFIMQRTARRILKEENIRLIHCRSFPASLIGYNVKKELNVKFIFDFRDFYADGGLEKTKGLAKFVFYKLKRLERPVIQSADKVVCLTHRARKVLIDWYLKNTANPESIFKVIPCCADFSHFDIKKVKPDSITLARTRARLTSNDFVLLYLGSLGTDYLLSQMLTLFRQVQQIKPNAKFLFVSNNGSELVEAECKKQCIPIGSIRFISADRSQIPSYISLADMSVFFYREGLRSIGCSPTKLAELFACNVPVIANTGVGDLDDIIDLERNGSVVVKDFSDATLKSAVQQILDRQRDDSVRIRENSREFALEEGVSRYASVYRELLNT